MVKIVLLILLFGRCWSSRTPMIYFRISEDGLQNAADVGVESVAEEARKLHINRLRKEISEGPVTANIILTDIKVPKFKEPKQTKVKLRPSDSVELNVKDFDVTITSKVGGVLYYNKIKVPLHGDATITVTGATINTKSQLKERNDIVQISRMDCDAHIDHATVKLVGGGIVSTVMNSNQKKIEEKFGPLIEKFVCNWLEKTGYKQFNEMIKSMPQQIDFDMPKELKHFNENFDYKHFKLKNKIIDDPIVTNDYIELSINSKLSKQHSKGDTDDVDIDAINDLKRPSSSESGKHMTNTWIGEELPNRILSFLHSQGALNIYLDPNNEHYGDDMRTSCSRGCVGTLFPQIEKARPNQDVYVKGIWKKPLHVTIENDETATITGLLNIFFYTKNKGRQSLALVADIDIKSSIYDIKMIDRHDKMELVGKVKTTKLEMTAVLSKVDGIERGQKLIDTNDIITDVLDSEFDSVFSNGITMPDIDAINLYNPELSSKTGSLRLSSDFKLDREYVKKKVRSAIEQFKNSDFFD